MNDWNVINHSKETLILVFVLSVWKSFSCQYIPKNVFLISQISSVFFLCVINHVQFLWNSLIQGSSPFLSFFLLNSENFLSGYFLLPCPLLSQPPWPWVKPKVLPSGYLPAGPPCLPLVCSACGCVCHHQPSPPPRANRLLSRSKSELLSGGVFTTQRHILTGFAPEI